MQKRPADVLATSRMYEVILYVYAQAAELSCCWFVPMTQAAAAVCSTEARTQQPMFTHMTEHLLFIQILPIRCGRRQRSHLIILLVRLAPEQPTLPEPQRR